ncbi:MAG: MerR family transcriptional regulator, partial [Bauldia sp.]
MASKGPEAFRTISEVAADLDLPQHVLRFWETRFAQIRPMKRGGGRRYYRPDDVDLLRGIRYLLYSEGYTIRGVQRILKEQGPRFVTTAGRGGLSGLAGAEKDEPPEGADAAELVELDHGEDAVPESAEPRVTFDPAEFRRRRPAPPVNGSRAQSGRLAGDDVRRLQATLTHLLELKRLLD